jgi:hypothetical protein
VSTYTVKSVGAEPREWTSSHGGTFLSYKVDFTTEDGQLEGGVEWNKKPESRAPSVGEQVVGHLEEGNFGPKFKIDYDATKELGGAPSGSSEARTGTGGGQGKNWQPERERDPERAARILRQHSQEMALRYLNISDDRPVHLEGVFALADEFDADVNRAGQAANQGHIGNVGSPAGVSSAPAPDSPPASTEQRDLEMAIAGASAENLPAQATALIASYMISELSEEDRAQACNQLTNSQDPQAQGMTIRAMKARTVKWSGAELPVADSDPDDTIPF